MVISRLIVGSSRSILTRPTLCRISGFRELIGGLRGLSYKPIYKAEVISTGGRSGQARSLDGNFQVKLSPPKELGGPGVANATNPEVLFAAGYSACFQGAMGVAAGKLKPLSPDTSVYCQVLLFKEAGGFKLGVHMKVTIPNLNQMDAQTIVKEAHRLCPYSNATRNNIDVTFEVIGGAK